MKATRVLYVIGIVGLLVLALAGLLGAQEPGPEGAQGELASAAFTYQGQLDQNGEPVSGLCSFAFDLYDAAQDGLQFGGPISRPITVTDGLFTTQLDFGLSPFQGEARWLGIQVMCDGDAAYADLGRQPLTAAPYALYSLGAPWDGLTGMPEGFTDGVDDTGIYTAGHGITLTGAAINVLTDTIQARVHEACGGGYAVRQINPDGSVECEPVAGGAGDITAVYTGFGLSGGGDAGELTLYVMTTTVQARLQAPCPAGSAIRAVDEHGTVTCQLDADTLADLSPCGEGQVARLSGGQWVCDDDADTLDSLPCNTNQVAKWTGSEWECR